MVPSCRHKADYLTSSGFQYDEPKVACYVFAFEIVYDLLTYIKNCRSAALDTLLLVAAFDPDSV